MKKMLAILLTLVLAFGIVWADSETLDSASDSTQIANTLNTYIDTKCLSIKSLQFIDFPELFDMQSKDAEKVYNYEAGRVKYYIESLKYTNDKLTDYSFNVDVIDSTVNDNKATVEAKVDINNYYSYMDGQIETNNSSHIFTLVKRDNQWLIANDEYLDEFKDAYGYGTDFEELVQNIASEEQKFIKEQAELEKKLKDKGIDNTTPTTGGVTPSSVPGDTFITYNRTTASNYAYQYSVDDGSKLNTSYNHNFIDFASGGNDCQNFASQCIWAGFGGKNDQTSINSHAIPMMYNWYADKTSYIPNWTSISNFMPLVTGNYNTDGYGVRAYDTTIGTITVGDLVIDPDGAHVMVVYSAQDKNSNGITDWDEIYICGHTNNRRNHNLKALYGSPSTPPSGMRFIKINNFKYNTGN